MPITIGYNTKAGKEKVTFLYDVTYFTLHFITDVFHPAFPAWLHYRKEDNIIHTINNVTDVCMPE